MFNPEPSRASSEQNRQGPSKRYARCDPAEAELHRSDAQASDDPRRRPRIPSFYPTMSISETGEAPTGDAAAQGAGL
jgi:hypothetical protein